MDQKGLLHRYIGTEFTDVRRGEEDIVADVTHPAVLHVTRKRVLGSGGGEGGAAA